MKKKKKKKKKSRGGNEGRREDNECMNRSLAFSQIFHSSFLLLSSSSVFSLCSLDSCYSTVFYQQKEGRREGGKEDTLQACDPAYLLL